MTRAELTRNVRLRLGETESQVREPLLLDEAVSMAADDVARRTDCYQTYEYCDIAGGTSAQTSFCLPPNLYKIKSVKVTNADSTVQVLTHSNREIVTRHWMDATNRDWQNPPLETGAVRLCVLERPHFYLWPYPAYNAVGGVTLYGYATPHGLWAADSTECPLPGWAHAAVELRACMLRTLQLMTKENQIRYQMLEREYERAVSQVAVFVNQEVSTASPKVGAL